MPKPDPHRRKLWSREFDSLKGIDLEYRRTDLPVSASLFLSLHRRNGRSPGKVLDIGCGKGRVGLHLARAGFGVTGFDFVESALRAFREKAKREPLPRPVRIFRQDMYERWKVPDRSMDAVFAITVIDNLTTAARRAHFRRELLRVLKPGGLLALEFFPPCDGYYGRLLRASGSRHVLSDPNNRLSFRLFTKTEVLRWLGKPFAVVAERHRRFRVVKYRHPCRRRTVVLVLSRERP